MMQKVKWIVHRASVMPFKEYIYRLKNLISGLFNFFLLKIGRAFLPSSCIPEESILRKSIFNGVFDYDIRKILPAKYKTQCISEADQIIHNKYSFFDLENYHFGSMINWNFDYKNKKAFPLRYSYFGSRFFRKDGDLKYVFEINKHQELVRLSEAFNLTGDKTYVNKLVKNTQTWMQQCPYLCSVNWASPTVMAYRLISWTISFEMLRRDYTFSDDFLNQWAQSVYQHIRMIRKNYSKFSSAGNHLISEVVGVFVASLQWKIFFKGGELTFLNFAQDEAYSILLNEAETQILPDGVNHEQAVSYQVFAANQFFLALFFGASSGILFPDVYKNRLYECAKFLASILNKNGKPPKFGDEDSAWAFRLCDRTSNKYLDQLAVFAVFFNDYSLIKQHLLSETVYWLFGSQAIHFDHSRSDRMFSIIKNKQKLEENVFPQGGYYLARFNDGSEKEILTFFDFGTLGTISTGAHGHADALSVCLSICGDWIFIDPGTYHYKNTIERQSLRVTSAHNTLNFGNLSSQDKYLGPFLWGKRHISSGAALSPGHFKGHVTWYTGETHSREIEFSEKNLLISDSWNGSNFPTIVFTLSHDLCPFISLDEDNIVAIRDKKFNCYLRSDTCLIVIENTKISPDFYQFTDSKKIVFYPEKCAGKQAIEIYWEFN